MISATAGEANLTATVPSLVRMENCAYSYEVLQFLDPENITKEDVLAWPCELREYWVSILPLVSLAQTLLHYGTIAIVVLGLVFNLVIICVLSTKRMWKTSTNLYLLTLAVYDSCVLIFNFLVGVLRAQNPETVNRAFQENEWLCLAHSVVVELFNLLSVWIIVCFTIERLIVVYFPLKAPKLCCIRRTKIIIVLISLFIFLLSLHKMFISGFEGDSVFGYKACITNRTKHMNFVYIDVAIKTWLPTIGILVLNCLTARQLHNSKVARRQLSSKVAKRLVRGGRGASLEVRITRTLFAVSGLYLILLLPLGIVQTLELCMKTDTHLPSLIAQEQSLYVESKKRLLLLKWIRALCFAFYQLNFGLNFFVYLLGNTSFRSVITQKFPGLCPQVTRCNSDTSTSRDISTSRVNLAKPHLSASSNSIFQLSSVCGGSVSTTRLCESN